MENQSSTWEQMEAPSILHIFLDFSKANMVSDQSFNWRLEWHDWIQVMFAWNKLVLYGGLLTGKLK